MNAALTNSIFALTQKNSITDVNADELAHLISEYPYFAPAQLAYAVKLKEDHHYKSDEQLQKTALYFSNPQWLEYQFMNGNLTQINPLNEEVHEVATPVEPIAATVTSPAPEEPIIEKAAELVPEKTEPVTETATHQESKFEIPTVETVKDMMYHIDHPVKQPVAISQTEQHTLPATEEEKDDAIAPTLSAYSPETEDIQMQKLSSVLTNQIADFNKPVTEDTKLEFEKGPFYTIDYFASQGIKFDPAKQPTDKLSQQLMTFTDWLKKMKNQSPNPQDLGTDPELENAIQGIANSSNEAREIITETMAEVFIKQGKLDKAVQLYIKLSFLDPEKSAYFAAKIQELKGM